MTKSMFLPPPPSWTKANGKCMKAWGQSALSLEPSILWLLASFFSKGYRGRSRPSWRPEEEGNQEPPGARVERRQVLTVLGLFSIKYVIFLSCFSVVFFWFLFFFLFRTSISSTAFFHHLPGYIEGVMNSSLRVTLQSHGEIATLIGVLFWILGLLSMLKVWRSGQSLRYYGISGTGRTLL